MAATVGQYKIVGHIGGPTMPVIYQCLQCKKDFAKKKAGGRAPLFCSRVCWLEYGKTHRVTNVDYVTRICIVCGDEKVAAEFPYQARKYNEGTPYRMRTCKSCWRKKYRQSIRETNREWEGKLRRTVIEGLGNACRCCGETTYEFLSIHHVDGWGKEHRQQFKKQSSLLRDIIRRGFPADEFEALCWNCHMAHTFHGGCPHKKISVISVVGA